MSARVPLLLRAGARRSISTSAVRRAEQVGTVGSAVPVEKPVGGFRGGAVHPETDNTLLVVHLMIFISPPSLPQLLGFSAATALGVYYLQEDTKVATGLLLSSVEELQHGTQRITSHLDRLTAVEKDLNALRAAAAVKEDNAKVRAEMKKVYDGLNLELLDLRAHVWGVEQDLQKVVKTESIRI
ncbi:uncharacterized protein EHS24_002200 [Apiotrichum porosum]|uniref:Uncharacterized protein n=1 Tax=Apiotrichum porosum TaxID=105984 RepID=A0A427XHX3_9TREE|nr:uncharacterized protein EHS24_002200 [Apiotrichum porosum]RSH78475.1 hypothetical protein EHS24_002200 [Apiotrichum porosum]